MHLTWQYNNLIKLIGNHLPISQKTLSTAECKYPTFDRELLGVYLATKYFRHFLEASDFVVFTDHKQSRTLA